MAMVSSSPLRARLILSPGAQPRRLTSSIMEKSDKSAWCLMSFTTEDGKAPQAFRPPASIHGVAHHHLDQLRPGAIERIRQPWLPLTGIADANSREPERARRAGEVKRRIGDV